MSEDRIDGPAGSRSVPVEREHLPVGHHDGGNADGYEERADERCKMQDGFDRQLHDSAADQNGVTALIGHPLGALDDQEGAVGDQKRCDSRDGEDDPLQAQRFPEHVRVPSEPNHSRRRNRRASYGH